MAAFDLSKWYADCTTANGDYAILYHAELRIGSVPIHYETLLHSAYSAGTSELVSLHRRSSAPSIGNGEILWQAPKWNAEARWTNLTTPVHEQLFNTEAGSLDWHCLAPSATASMHIGPHTTLTGHGYVEHLHLTVPPWRLPIRSLRWGRFVNSTDSLVWIDWTGDYAKRVVSLNGAPALASSIEDTNIVLKTPNAHLSFTNSRIIREGKLGATALAVIPRLGTLFPNSVLNIHECKFISNATLQRPGEPDSIGFAIHEIVTWP